MRISLFSIQFKAKPFVTFVLMPQNVQKTTKRFGLIVARFGRFWSGLGKNPLEGKYPLSKKCSSKKRDEKRDEKTRKRVKLAVW